MHLKKKAEEVILAFLKIDGFVEMRILKVVLKWQTGIDDGETIEKLIKQTLEERFFINLHVFTNNGFSASYILFKRERNPVIMRFGRGKWRRLLKELLFEDLRT